MQLHTFSDPGEYLRLVQPFLQEDEVTNNLILGVTLRLRDQPGWTAEPPYLAAVVGPESEVLLAAAMTPPYNLLAAADPGVPEPGVDLVLEHLRAQGWSVPGVTAEQALAERIARRWSALTGQVAEVKMRMRIYRLEQVIPPPNPPPGHFRPASMADLDTLTAWRSAFMQEALHEPPPEDARVLTERAIQAGTLYVWDDGGPVSMASCARGTPGTASIGLVYTPPALRGRAYASACVAALSQEVLDSGKTFATLFTDLDYPTSNAIYQRIGYRPAGDFRSYGFA